MKEKAKKARLEKRRASYERLKTTGFRDDGPAKRLRSGGYKRPGSLSR